jgi:hypothetical protein
MRELKERDMRILTKGFLNALNDAVNGDESRCIDSVQVFNMADLGAFGSVVVPHVVQELIHQGLVNECETRGQVRITRRGKDRLNRTIGVKAAVFFCPDIFLSMLLLVPYPERFVF